jgi:hypothetical protein
MSSMREPEALKASPSPRPRSPWVALALTLLAPFALFFAQRVTLPGVDESTLENSILARGYLGILALGITPFLTAAFVVEFAALIVPPWRHLRHGGPQGRRKLSRATVVLALGLAVFQAYGISTVRSTVLLRPSMASSLLLALTLVAGVALTHLVAEAVSLRGLASGYGVLLAGLPFLEVFKMREDPGAQITARDILGFLGAFAMTAAVTWYILERSAPARTSAQTTATYREAAAPQQAPPLALPAPTPGIIPLAIVVSLPAAIMGFGPMLPNASLLEEGPFYRPIALAAVLAAAFVFTRLFNPPRRVAEVYARARGEGASRAWLEEEARAELRPAAMRAVAFLFALMAIDMFAAKISRLAFAGETMVLTVALGLDIAAELRARRAMPDLVSVWPEHRPYAIAAAREVLEAAGIPVHVRGERLRRLLQFFAPYVPIDLMVPQAHANHAAKLLERVLLARETGASYEGAKAPIARPTGEGRAKERPSAGIVAAAIVSLAGLMVLWIPARRPPSEIRTATVSLEIVSVDDEHEIVDDATRRELSAGALPNGLSFQQERVSLGPDETAARLFVRLRRDEAETLEAARARLEAWTKTIALPEGVRVAVSESVEVDDASGAATQTGWRTYLLKGAPILTAADVVSAKAMPDAQDGRWRVAVQVGREGASRFEAYTSENIKRRLAIVLDGRVVSAPMIAGRIPGSYLSISMGAGPVEQQKADAQKLARALGGD